MSLMFNSEPDFDPKLVPTMLSENALLIKIITEYQNNGKIYECMKYQKKLLDNLGKLSINIDFPIEEDFTPQQMSESKGHKKFAYDT